MHFWPRLFKHWIATSCGYITIQWLRIRKTNFSIPWIAIYPADGVIHLLNNWSLVSLYIMFLIHQGQRKIRRLFNVIIK